MNKKKYIRYLVLGFLIMFSLVGESFAAEDFFSNLASGITNYFFTALTWFVIQVLEFIIAFMAGILTFGILLFTNMIDMMFLKVPYIGDMLGVKGDIAYGKTINIITTLIVFFSLIMWLIIGGASYIKDIYEEWSKVGKGNTSTNYTKDLLFKFMVVFLIFIIPFSLPIIFKGVNAFSSGILSMVTSSYTSEDRIIIVSKPLTTLVELGLSLPSVEGLSGDQEQNEGKQFSSIYNRSSGEGINDNGLDDNTIQMSAIINSVLDKAMFQTYRFMDLGTKISKEKTTSKAVKKVEENGGEISTSEVTQSLKDGHLEGLVVFMFISVIYIIMLYIVFMKLFALFMALITRFVNIILTSIYFAFHLAMLGNDNTRPFGMRNIWSFIGDIIVTPLLASYIGICIVILGWFSNVIVGNSIMYFGSGVEGTSYETVLFTSIIILAILWGILNKMVKTVEYIGANFENIISSRGGEGMKDSYASSAEAIDAAGKTFGLGKTVAKGLGVAKASSMIGGVIAAKASATIIGGKKMLGKKSSKLTGGNNTDLPKSE